MIGTKTVLLIMTWLSLLALMVVFPKQIESLDALALVLGAFAIFMFIKHKEFRKEEDNGLSRFSRD